MTAGPLNLGDARVLVVDDQPENLDIVVAMLESTGCEIFAALSGSHALELPRDFTPDQILLDVRAKVLAGELPTTSQ